MTQEEKQLLLTDLCARLPYRPKGVKLYGLFDPEDIIVIGYTGKFVETDNDEIPVEKVRLYLRPLSSMTDEEFKKLIIYTELQYDQLVLKDWDNGSKTLEFYLSEIPHYCVNKVFDWLNRHHFDHRGLIEQGLALEAPKDMYN